MPFAVYYGYGDDGDTVIEGGRTMDPIGTIDNRGRYLRRPGPQLDEAGCHLRKRTALDEADALRRRCTSLGCSSFSAPVDQHGKRQVGPLTCTGTKATRSLDHIGHVPCTSTYVHSGKEINWSVKKVARGRFEQRRCAYETVALHSHPNLIPAKAFPVSQPAVGGKGDGPGQCCANFTLSSAICVSLGFGDLPVSETSTAKLFPSSLPESYNLLNHASFFEASFELSKGNLDSIGLVRDPPRMIMNGQKGIIPQAQPSGMTSQVHSVYTLQVDPPCRHQGAHWQAPPLVPKSSLLLSAFRLPEISLQEDTLPLYPKKSRAFCLKLFRLGTED
nr:hypothetical protein Iba_chr01aCG2240 [Ipomoea batatas]